VGLEMAKKGLLHSYTLCKEYEKLKPLQAEADLVYSYPGIQSS